MSSCESIPPTEEANELTSDLDALDAIGFVRTLRGVDAQMFTGWRHYEGMLDERPLRAAEAAAEAAAAALKQGGCVVLTGCGTSGRVAHLVARRCNHLMPADPCAFDYLISGGDAALLLSDELPEDDPMAGATEISKVAAERPPCFLIGISCGLSAPYVAGQLDHALVASDRFGAAAIGFNPASLSRNAPIAGLQSGGTFRDVATSLAARGALLNPVVGPEAIAGSSRMKGGSATLILADAVCYRALQLSRGEAAPSIAAAVGSAHEAVRTTYLHAHSIATVCEAAGAAMRAGGRLYYVGEGAAGVLGCLDASEMPDTYGVPFDTVRGFVCGGWAAVANREGDLSGRSPLLCISLDDFGRDVVQQLTSADAVVLLASATEPRGARRSGAVATVDADDFDGFASDRLWALVLRLRRAGVASVAMLAVARATEAEGLRNAASMLDACAIIPLSVVGLGPGHGGLADLSLKLMLNLVSTYAMTCRGLVFRNRMIGTSPTNDKIYHRCVRLIGELAAVSHDAATTALLRSIYKLDHVPAALVGAPTADHIIAATPVGAAQFAQQLVLPIAILLAFEPSSPVAKARAALLEEPRVSLLLRRLRPTGGAGTPATGVPPPAVAAASAAVAAEGTEAVPAGEVTRDANLGKGAPYLMGLDLGATSIKSALFHSSDGSLAGVVRRQTLGDDARDVDAVVGALHEAANSLLTAAGLGWSSVGAVGLSQPGAIEPATGHVAAAANFPWPAHTPLRELLEAKLGGGVRVVMVADAEAALLAELLPAGAAGRPATGAPHGASSHVAVLIALGGGVGSSLAIDGRIWRGAHGLIEGGHMIIDGMRVTGAAAAAAAGLLCGCGQWGCLETIASGPALVERARRRGWSPPSLSSFHRPPPAIASSSVVEELEARHVLEAAAEGDAVAQALVEESARALAVACINIARVVDPHVIVLAGGLATPTLLAPTLAAFKQRAWTILPAHTPIVLAAAGADAGVVGAAAAAASTLCSTSSPPPPPPVSCAISPDDAADAFVVRAATPADRSAALRVCVLTGNAGADATTLFPTDPEALGKRWVAPYLDLEPTLAFVLEEVATGAVCGYCLGALDTAAFAVRLQTSYLPPLRAAHPDPAKLGKPEPEWTAEERVYHELHDLAAGCVPTGLDAALYPSHLHLDLTPHAQGRGHGARMMGALLAALRRAGSTGAFLQMHESNARARRFYEKLGFRQLHGVGETTAGGTGGAFYMGLRLA